MILGSLHVPRITLTLKPIHFSTITSTDLTLQNAKINLYFAILMPSDTKVTCIQSKRKRIQRFV